MRLKPSLRCRLSCQGQIAAQSLYLGGRKRQCCQSRQPQLALHL
ncbi:Uncharacterised protein [Vibrio cholerae]|nr:Uncharacterised protein [Vibrio cholerae]